MRKIGHKKRQATFGRVAYLFCLKKHYMKYSENIQANQYYSPNIATWLHISIKKKYDITDSFGNEVPYPHTFYEKNNLIVYCWLLDGFFDTEKGHKHLNDIIARFKLHFEHTRFEKIARFDNENKKFNALKLKEFKHLKSIVSKANYRILNNFDGTRDFVFWCLKLHAEYLISQMGIFSYHELLEFGLDNFIDKIKDRSTLRAKCKNIFNWYLDRNFEATQYIKKNKEEVLATRQQHAKKLSEKKSEDAKKKVLNCITGMFADEYKKKSGVWNISKIAKDLGMSRNTVAKHLPTTTLF